MNLLKQKRTVWHWIAVALLVLLAAAVWFGLHPSYRYVSGILLVLALVSALLPKITWLLSAGGMLGVVALLWRFGPSGYRYASVIPMLCAVLIVLFHFGGRVLRIAAASVTAVIAAILIGVQTPILLAAMEEPAQNVPYVVVLGAAVYGETPSLSLQNRIKRAMEYLEANPKSKVVVSGGQGEGEDISEAECMRRYLVEHGVDESRILVEDHSTSTMENLAFSKAVIESDGGSADRIVIVSSGYHLYRAKTMAKSIGMIADGAASRDGYPIFMTGMNIREALAVMKLWTLGRWERQACLASVYAVAARSENGENFTKMFDNGSVRCYNIHVAKIGA